MNSNHPSGDMPEESDTAMTQVAQETYTIYALVHPIDKQVRYVGISKRIERRFKEHLIPPVHPWIQQLIDQGLQPALSILETGLPDMKTGREHEKHWIQRYTDMGHPLENQVHNMDALRDREMAEIEAQREREVLARMTPAEREHLNLLHTFGFSHYGNRYWSIFWGTWQTAQGPYLIDADSHRIEIAEIALQFCAIPTRRMEGRDEQ